MSIVVKPIQTKVTSTLKNSSIIGGSEFKSRVNPSLNCFEYFLNKKIKITGHRGNYLRFCNFKYVVLIIFIKNLRRGFDSTTWNLNKERSLSSIENLHLASSAASPPK